MDELDDAISTEKGLQIGKGDLRTLANERAETALKYLFENYPDTLTVFKIQCVSGHSGNRVDHSYNANKDGFGSSGLNTAIDNKVGDIFASMNVFFTIYNSSSFHSDDVVDFALTIAKTVGPRWDSFIAEGNDNELNQLFDQHDFTEGMRRLPGFLDYVKGMLKPLIEPAEEQGKTNFVLQRIIEHLNCNGSYYTVKYLEYLSKRTDGRTIVDTVRQLIGGIKARDSDLASSITDIFDADRAYVDEQNIVIPGFESLTWRNVMEFGNNPNLPEPNASVMTIDVPSDGVHLEIAKGNCVVKKPWWSN